MEKKNWKKILRSVALVFALAGSFVLLFFTFLINDALDKTRDSVISNINGIQGTLLEMESAVDGADRQLNATAETFDSLEASFLPISEGLESTGNALVGMSQSLAAFKILGMSLSEQANELKDAGNSMFEASENLQETDFEEHKNNIAGFRVSLQEIKEDISMQRLMLGETKETVENVVGLMKIANVLLFFVIISIFMVGILNSTAGLI
ncbi:hypothetical protein JXA56_05505 [Candidatus Micrarchaeota archaeon]|nr:hypothetical protein [Candidatus Micrarchaeota archaeon]